MSVQLMAAPTSAAVVDEPRQSYHNDLDLDLIDQALDRGDLETVRHHLGLSRGAWHWLLRNL